eukprot:scaffold1436_cov42-Prasinocladus_malaysianus.AAC.1
MPEKPGSRTAYVCIWRFQVLKKRSEEIFDCREQQHINPMAGTDHCPRMSPAKSPARRQSYMRKKAGNLPGADEEIRRLRWHRGQRDDMEKLIADCTALMPCRNGQRYLYVCVQYALQSSWHVYQAPTM